MKFAILLVCAELVSACTQFSSFAGSEPAPAPVAASASTPAPDVLPVKVGDCSETTITHLTGYWGHKLHKRKQSIGEGVSVQYSNKGGGYSLDDMPEIAASQVGDRVKMCLISIPTHCPPGDDRGRVYQTTNLRTNQSWSLPDDVHGCGGA